ncbi:putative calcium-binding protein CML19 [Juglans microcarpa x Juglans regia]|uniref:putative calcium-binding protein CML19 n=1 Tax=Juglans microcarpa x Juglans regia TaxID=2249226 RepID=UPI001B7ED686|nr:putative calcium-binding protein CML19 [Juglans microcarpa x Juglans regia]
MIKAKHDASSSPPPLTDGKHNNVTSPKSALGKLCRKLSSRKSTEKQRSLLGSDSETTNKLICSELQKVFDYLDVNGDGKISPAELQGCVTTVGGTLSVDEAEETVKSSDLNGDGLLDFEEFQKLMETSGEDEKNDTLKEAFAMYEMEGSGCITPTSLKRMLNRLGDSKSVEDCKAMIRKFDLNGDGVLSFEEFRVMMH